MRVLVAQPADGGQGLATRRAERALNPNGWIPVLIWDGHAMYE